MKKYSFILCIALVAFVVASCGLKGNHTSSGRAYELLVVVDHGVWDRAAGRALHDALDADMPGLPQSEPSFRIMYTSPKDYDSTLKLIRNIIIVDIQDIYTKASFKYAKDVYANPQMILTIQAPNEEEFEKFVDIQAKLQAGKGAGYARWAKVFNLKQMAQTMNYLSENNLLEYAVLEEKAAAATAHHNELSAQIKAAEKRMAEIAVLRTHIVNYAKTREVYVAYRKAGYSKKFREEHEEEILLHQAAKNAFDEMGVKKLPKVKELQTEYAKLLEEKKKTYSEYRRSREEMRELLTAKANVDRVLKMEVEQDVEKEKDHGQR